MGAGSILARAAAPATARTRQYLMCGALRLLSFLGYTWVVALVGARTYEWISAAKGYEQIYLRSVVFGVPASSSCAASGSCQWVLIGGGKPTDPHLESEVLPLLARQDADQVEPPGLGGRRLAIHVVSAVPGAQDRAADGDLHPARAGLHRPAHHGPVEHADPQESFNRLPGLRGLDPDVPVTIGRNVFIGEKTVLSYSTSTATRRARPHLRMPCTASADRRALARVPGPAYRRELPAGLGQARGRWCWFRFSAVTLICVFFLYLPLLQGAASPCGPRFPSWARC